MSEQEIIQHMIEYVEEKERQVSINKLGAVAQNKSDVVKAILDELDRVMANENK